MSRYVNKEKLVKAGTLYCYFVKNPNYDKKVEPNIDGNEKIKWNGNRKDVILFDIIDKSIIYFERIKDLLIYLEYKNTKKIFSKIKKYMITEDSSKCFKNRYRFLY